MTAAKATLLIIIATGAVVLLWLGHSLRVLSVASGSMAPLIHKGDAVVVHKTNPQDIQVGDIVSYVSPRDSSLIITHRVVQIFPETERLMTRGDANEADDPAFHTSRVIGVVDRTLPAAGRLVDILHTWWGLALLAYGPLAAIAVRELAGVWRHYIRPTYILTGHSR
jgi:signal peptidase I